MKRAAETTPPVIADDPVHAKAIHVDLFQPIDEQTVLLVGWLWDPFGEADSLELLTPDGPSIELIPSLHRFGATNPAALVSARNLDAALTRPGFIALIELPEPDQRHEGYRLRVRRGETVFELAMPPPQLDPYLARNRLLCDLPLWFLTEPAVLAGYMGPALLRLQARLQRLTAAHRIYELGTPPARPEVSIVIPIYERMDFVEAQLALFAGDPDLRDAEIIYVLDSPQLDEPFAEAMFHHHRLYRLPVRIVVMARNGGYAAANNTGVAHARGRLLALLNSDVVPDRPGWLSRMAAFHDAHPRVGVTGAKLLYEDDSLQHAGLYYSRQHTPHGFWVCHHYFKGLHRDLPEAALERPVPAVTGACLMIERELYTRVGGMSEEYVIGDYEDSDLCLRVGREGLETWYQPNVELYHLEGQSYGDIRARASRFNCWLHDSRWRPRIDELMRQPRFDPALRAAGIRRTARQALSPDPAMRSAEMARSAQTLAADVPARRRSSRQR